MKKMDANQKSPKQSKLKKKPLKVVYISNPVKLTTTPAEFRDVVQEFTGQDSNVAEEYGDWQINEGSSFMNIESIDSKFRADRVEHPNLAAINKDLVDKTIELPNELAFTSQVLENFSSLCESHQFGGGFWEY